MSDAHQNSVSREFAFKFLYRCVQEKIFFYQPRVFEGFVEHFPIPSESIAYAQKLIQGTLDCMTEYDTAIEKSSDNWHLGRINLTDLCILRMACFEFKGGTVPRNVVINEAIDLAKKYGTEHSGAFVNGVLDRLAL